MTNKTKLKTKPKILPVESSAGVVKKIPGPPALCWNWPRVPPSITGTGESSGHSQKLYVIIIIIKFNQLFITTWLMWNPSNQPSTNGGRLRNWQESPAGNHLPPTGMRAPPLGETDCIGEPIEPCLRRFSASRYFQGTGGTDLRPF